MIGQRFGRLVVVEESDPYIKPSDGKRERRWRCRCDCGGETVTLQKCLRRMETKSCGCLRDEMRPALRATHGHGRKGKQTKTYRSWAEMGARCSNPKSNIYAYYGGRGIKVCERWQKFENFLADMGERPTDATLDRWPNKNGNYEPGNCRWATKKEQARNTRGNRLVNFRGVEMCLAEVAEITGVDYGKLHLRLRRGWSLERAAS